MESKKLLLAVIFYLAFGILAITLYASTLGTTGTDFDTGTYGNTSYNTTGSFVFLGLTELPANQTNDTALKMNMTGNVLLLHLNNNSALGENNTTFFDSSGTGVNGTCMTNTGNCSIFEPAGKLSGAMNFSGHNEINFTSDAALPSGNNDRTIMMWIFPTSITEADRILSYGAWSAGNAFDIDFGQSSTNTTGYIWVIGHTNNYGSTDTAVQKNSWSHIAITLSGTNTLKFYINGSLKVTNTSVSLNTQGAGAWRLGNVLDTRGLPAPFFGTIDEVAIWNRTLSSEEIKEIYVRQIALNGNYTSKVFDSAVSNNLLQWQSITWTEGAPYGEELPDNQRNETGLVLSPANMTGNVLLMHLNEQSNGTAPGGWSVQDTSGNNNHGNESGGVTFNVSGKLGTALSFDGIDDIIRVPDSSSLDSATGAGQPRTIVFWFRTTTTGNRVVFEKGENLHFIVQTEQAPDAGRISWRVETTAVNRLKSNSFVNDNGWHHFAGTYTGSVAALYIDGEFQNSSSQTAPADDNNQFVIGARPSVAFPGTIDEVAIFNRSLSSGEIRDFYLRGAAQLNLTVRTSPDNITWTDFRGVNNTTTSFANSSLANLSGFNNFTYLQYKFDFETIDSNFSVELYNVTINYTGTFPPDILNISTTPSSADDFDPDVTVNVTANVSGRGSNASVVMFEYYINSSTRQNITMLNTTNTTRWASFVANATGNWSYKIYANDSFGNANNTTTNVIEVALDQSWGISATSFGTISAGIGDNITLINLTVNNTGDFPLDFNFSKTPQTVPTITFNVSTLSLQNNTTKSVQINATAPLTAAPYDVSINITANITALPKNNYTNGTLVSYAAGPFLYTTIDYANSTIAQGETIYLNAKVQNLGNESASGSWLNWNAPSDWALSGTNASLGVLSVNEINWNNFSGTVSSSALTGTQTVIAHPGFTDFRHNQTSNASTTVVVLSSGGGGTGGGTSGGGGPGGGGGGAGGPSLTNLTEEVFELVRGKNQSFFLIVKNPFNDGVLQDVKINVSGFLSQYIRVEPAEIPVIGINQSRAVTAFIVAPVYFTEGIHVLNFTIIGFSNRTGFGFSRITDKRLVNLVVIEISKEEAQTLLNESAIALEQMREKGFNVEGIEELVKSLNSAYESRIFKNVIDLHKQIITARDNAFEADKELKDLELKLKDAREQGASVSQTRRLFDLAQAALRRGDFGTALARAKDAQLTYALETKGFFSLVYFITHKPTQAIAVVMISIGTILLIGLGAEFSYLSYTLSTLFKEEKILLGLMKQMQREAFDEKKMSMSEYMEAMLQYENRLNDVVQKIVEFESKKQNLFTVSRAELRLKQESERLLELIKQTQKRYLEAGDIETRIYQDKMKSFTARLGEVDEKLALIEAESAIKSQATLLGKIKNFLKWRK